MPPQDVQQTLIASRQKQAYYDNLKGKALAELQLGQIVKMKKLNENIWTEAVCKKMIASCVQCLHDRQAVLTECPPPFSETLKPSGDLLSHAGLYQE